VHNRDRDSTSLWTKTDPGTATALQRLTEAGYPIAVVSNNDGRLHHQLTTAGLADYVAAIVDSAVAGVAKPSPQIFNHAAGRLGVRLDDCIMIGDDPYFDIRASLHAGAAAAILIDPGTDRPATWSTPAYPDLLGAVTALLDCRF
jgi:putative hydrolase of the HAD superfamily